MTPYPSLRAQYRAARVIDLYDRRRDRLETAHAAALSTLRIAAANDPERAATSQPATHRTIPGYVVTVETDWTVTVERTADPIPHEWTQTSMDDYMEPDA